MRAEAPACAPSAAAGESGALAREMAAAYRRMAEFYREQVNLSPQEADARAREPMAPERREQLLASPQDQVSWYALNSLAEHDPDSAWAVWERLKRDAQAELASGHRAARAVEFGAGPWERAQFLAVRASLMEQWQPQSGIEQVLIEALAQAQMMYTVWLESLHQRTMCEAMRERTQIERDHTWEPPRLNYAEAIEEAATMVDRWNRLFLRTLRQLRDLRRYTPSVVVGNVSQLNIAQQQMNIAATQQNAE